MRHSGGSSLAILGGRRGSCRLERAGILPAFRAKSRSDRGRLASSSDSGAPERARRGGTPALFRATWPVLAGDDERWAVRSAIDAVAADAYGLSRDQYAHVLSTFSHASYRKAPELCLARFNESKNLWPGKVHPQVRSLLGHPLEREPPPTRHRPSDPQGRDGEADGRWAMERAERPDQLPQPRPDF